MHSAEGVACYIVDIGDHVDRSHPVTEGTQGRGNIRLLNEAGYDAVTIGNNEGIAMSKEALSTLYTDAQFDVLVSNLFEKDGSRPAWLLPYRIQKTAAGTSIGFLGATAEYTAFYSKLGYSRIETRFRSLTSERNFSPWCRMIPACCLCSCGKSV